MNKTQRNGQNVDPEIATDRSFLYGDGVFTTIVINEGVPLLLEQHLARLLRDCNRLKIDNVCVETIRASLFSSIEGIKQAILRITISRSSGERGYLCQNPEPVVWTHISDGPADIEKHRTQGISLRLCHYRLTQNPYLAGIKHCNRLEQVLARNEWNNSDFQEGLMLDQDDNVIEGTMSNLFCIKGREIFTPDLTFTGVEGIIRQLIINITKQLSVPLTIENISIAMLKEADAIFVTNSVIGIWPVAQFDDRSYERHSLIQILEEELGKQL